MGHDKLIYKLTKNTGVTVEEAEAVLKSNKWNILDAVLQLEDMGKVESPEVKVYFSKDQSKKLNEVMKYNEEKSWQYHKGYGDTGEKQNAFQRVCGFIEQCNEIFIVVRRQGENIIHLPITVVVLLLFFSWRTMILVIIVSLLCNVEFSIEGQELGRNGDSINEFFHKAHHKAGQVRDRMRDNMKKHGKRK